ncbi:Adenylate cyclase [Geitlerinema sp. FC II]|nr:Adenylate cyclase [Geitlerinema sp. FC II]
MLDLDGTLERGYRVTLQIRETPNAHPIEVKADLPPNPELAQTAACHWEETYRGVESLYRINPKKIVQFLHPQQRRERCHQSAKQLQEQLQRWLDADSFREIDRRLREVVSPEDSLEFLVRTDDRNLQKLPWHLWDYLKRHSSEAAFSAIASEPPLTVNLTHRKPKVRVLAILGHSAGIDVEIDRQLLENLPHADVEFLVEAKPEEIGDRIWEQPWDIVFFAGHSQTEGDTGRLYINPNDSITVDRLWHGLRKAVEGGLKIAIFNSCDGLGLVQQLNDTQIPCLVVMRELVPDRVAQTFLKYFLQSFSGGTSFYEAVRDARRRLELLDEEFPCASWLPAVFQHPGIVPPTWNELRGVRRPHWRSILGLAAAGVAGSVLVSWGIAPQLAVRVNRSAKGYHENGQLFPARLLYQFAGWLNPRKGIYHYNLGYLCDETGDIDCALSAHRIAALRGAPEGYAEAARLSIVRGDLHGALNSVTRCLEDPQYTGVRVACLKNLGWIRYEQEYYGEAERIFREALAIAPNSPHTSCLLARTLEALDRPQDAQTVWTQFLDLPNTTPDVPELGTCILDARVRLGNSSRLVD